MGKYLLDLSKSYQENFLQEVMLYFRSFSVEFLIPTRHLIEKYTDILLQEEDNVNIGIRQLQLPVPQYVSVLLSFIKIHFC